MNDQLNLTSHEKRQIDRKVHEIHKRKLAEWPMCIFCLQKVNSAADPCHLVRRSERSKYFSNLQMQTADWNVWPGHRTCHETYDNDPELAETLPGYRRIMNFIKANVPDIYIKRISL